MLADVPGVAVTGQERGGSLVAVVLMAAPLDAALVPRLRERLAAIAVPVEFVTSSA
ncbi:MAG: hypothetical protein H7238_17935, partial [Polaromonas sp.]|nr:hypothetical protein [Polaromonas sp.]